MKERDTFLQELIRLEGRGNRDLWSHCRLCSQPATMRCEDCFGGEMFCSSCMVDLHAINPLHRIEVCVYCYCYYYYAELWPRNGMAHTLSQQHSRGSASAFNWAISLEIDALIRLKPRVTTLSLSTQTACTVSVSTIVPARKPRTWSPNYFERVGTLPQQPTQSLPPLSTFSSFFTYYLSNPKLPFSNSIIP
jgi:hypothetical protein